MFNIIETLSKLFQTQITAIQQQWSHTHYSTPHTLWGCAGELASALAAAIILAEAIVTPPSPI